MSAHAIPSIAASKSAWREIELRPWVALRVVWRACEDCAQRENPCMIQRFAQPAYRLGSGLDHEKPLVRWGRVTSGPTVSKVRPAVGSKGEKGRRSRDNSISI